MNRRDFLKKGALLGGVAAIATASPVLADHVVEPKNPVIGIGLEVYHYTNRNATLQRLFQIIPENGVQPPGSYPVTVEVRDAVDPQLVVGTLQAYELKYIASTLPIDPVSGLPIVDFNMRVEPKVSIPAAIRRLGNPSEHWRETLKVNRIAERNHRKYLWAVPWNHANTGPHTKFTSPYDISTGKAGRDIGGYAETAQANQSLELIPPGTILEFEHMMFTDETRRVFVQTLRVIVGPLPGGVPVTTTTGSTTTTTVPPTTTTGGNSGSTTTVPPTTTVPETTTTVGTIAP